MPMSPEHKAKIAASREETAAIKAYLELLGDRRPGRPVTTDSVNAKIAKLEAKLAADSDPLVKVTVTQALLDAKAQLKSLSTEVDTAAAEAGFVKYAKAYSARKGISYTAWRSVGVSSEVLKKAGIARTRRG